MAEVNECIGCVVSVRHGEEDGPQAALMALAYVRCCGLTKMVGALCGRHKNRYTEWIDAIKGNAPPPKNPPPSSFSC